MEFRKRKIKIKKYSRYDPGKFLVWKHAAIQPAIQQELGQTCGPCDMTGEVDSKEGKNVNCNQVFFF
jgi:hypothetical protein